MAGLIGIIGGFGDLLEACGLAFLAKPFEATPRKQLMDIGLVANVEDQLVLGEMKEAMKRDGEFDVAKVGGEVSPIFGAGGNHLIPEARTKQVELPFAEGFQRFMVLYHFLVDYFGLIEIFHILKNY